MDSSHDRDLHTRLQNAFGDTRVVEPPRGLAERAMVRIRLDQIQRGDRERFRTRLAQGGLLALGAAAALAILIARVPRADAWDWSIPGGWGAADFLVASVGDWGSMEAAATVVGAAVIGVSLLALSAFRSPRIGQPADR